MTLGKPGHSAISPTFSSGRTVPFLSAGDAFRTPTFMAAGLSNRRQGHAFPSAFASAGNMGEWKNHVAPALTANQHFARMVRMEAEAQSSSIVQLELNSMEAQEEGKQELYSHEVISKSIRGLSCMEHRGGCSADSDSGDGAGIM